MIDPVKQQSDTDRLIASIDALRESQERSIERAAKTIAAAIIYGQCTKGLSYGDKVTACKNFANDVWNATTPKEASDE